MTYVTLYRKWRPQRFEDVAGQKRVVQTLVNSLNTGNLAHAYLFAGPRGTGKTTVARLLAKGLNCNSGPTAEPCEDCLECRAILEGNSLNVIEIDGASNRRIDDIRELRAQVRFAPVDASYKVYIIDEVHMLTPEAFNALLKTLEEPPAHVVFIFATTDPHKLPATILSRVQRFDFQRLTETDLIARLNTVIGEEGFEVDEAALTLMAQHAEGGMRDALGILEKCAAYSDRITGASVAEVLGVAPQEQVAAFIGDLFAGRETEALKVVDELYRQGKDLAQFVRSVLGQLRQEVVSGEKKEEQKEMLRAVQVLSENMREMRYALDPRIPLEIAVLKIILKIDSPTGDVFAADLEEKVFSLEKEVEKLRSQIKAGLSTKETEIREKPSVGKRRPAGNDQANSAYILENWEEYLQNLRNEKLMQCEAFLREGIPVGVQGGTLTIAFPKDRGFHKASMEQENYRDAAERILSRFLGSATSLNCVFQNADGSGKTSGRTEPKGKPKQEKKPAASAHRKLGAAEREFMEASKRIFGGDFIKGKENETEDI